jgi:hypothetical protein
VGICDRQRRHMFIVTALAALACFLVGWTAGSARAQHAGPNFRKPKGCQLIEITDPDLQGLDVVGACPVSKRGQMRLDPGDIYMYCGPKIACGNNYGHVRSEGGYEFLVDGQGFKIVEPDWEESDVPTSFPTILAEPPEISCVKATVSSSSPAPFFRLDRPEVATAEVKGLEEIDPGSRVVVCERLGDRLVKSFVGRNTWRVGLMAKADLQLSGQLVDPASIVPDVELCGTFAWEGETSRRTFVYEPDNSGQLRAVRVANKGDVLLVLSAVGGRTGKRGVWYEAVLEGKRGFVPPEVARVRGLPRLWVPKSGRRYCPTVDTVAHSTCSWSLKPDRWADEGRLDQLPEAIPLDEKSLLPVVEQAGDQAVVMAFDMLATLSGGECVEYRPTNTMVLTLKADQLLKAVPRTKRTGGTSAGRTASWESIPLKQPTALVNRPGKVAIEMSGQLTEGQPSRSVVEAYAQELPSPRVFPADLDMLLAAGAESLVLRALTAGPESYGLRPAVQEALERLRALPVPNAANTTGGMQLWLQKLAAESDEAVLPRSRVAIDLLGDGANGGLAGAIAVFDASPDVSASILVAESLRQEGLTLASRELFLGAIRSVGGGGASLFVPAFDGYRSATRGVGHARNVVEVLGPVCENGPSRENRVDACVASAQGALEFESAAAAAPFLVVLKRLAPDDPRLLEMEGRIAGAESDDAAVNLYGRAVAQAASTCPLDSELVQGLLLQLVRVAYELDGRQRWQDVPPYVLRLLRYTLPGTMVSDYTLFLQVLGNSQEFRRALGLLNCARFTARSGRASPELDIVRGYVQLHSCDFASAKASLERAERRLAVLGKFAESISAEWSRLPPESGPLPWLQALDRAFRKHRLLSSNIPEFRPLLKSSGTCGRWFAAERESCELGSLVQLGLKGPLPSLQDRLTEIGRTDADACTVALGEANKSFQMRLGALHEEQVRKFMDIELVMADDLEQALLLRSFITGLAKKRFCRDMAEWGRGEEPGWIAQVDGLLLPFRPDCSEEELGITLATEQARRIRSATRDGKNLCAKRPGPGAADGTGAGYRNTYSMVRTWVRDSAMCLAQAKATGADHRGLRLLLERYLPALRLIQSDDLATVPEEALPKDVRAGLEEEAYQNDDRMGYCAMDLAKKLGLVEER